MEALAQELEHWLCHLQIVPCVVFCWVEKVLDLEVEGRVESGARTQDLVGFVLEGADQLRQLVYLELLILFVGRRAAGLLIVTVTIFIFILIEVVIVVIGGGRSVFLIWIGDEFARLHLEFGLLVMASKVLHRAERMPVPLLEGNRKVNADLHWDDCEIGRISRAAHLKEYVLSKAYFLQLSNAKLIKLVGVLCAEARVPVVSLQLIEHVSGVNHFEVAVNVAEAEGVHLCLRLVAHFELKEVKDLAEVTGKVVWVEDVEPVVTAT